MVDREMDYNYKKNSSSRKFMLSGKLDVKMTPPRVLRVFRVARYRLHR